MNGTESTLPLIAITMGDPCGVGAEIIVKAFGNDSLRKQCAPLVIGDTTVMQRALAVTASPLSLQEISAPEMAIAMPDNIIPILPLSNLSSDDMVFGAPTTASGDAVYRYICEGTRLALRGDIAAVVTAPINKKSMNNAGHDYPGHTELLAELCGVSDFVMMLAGDILRVSLVTIHEAIASVPSLINRDIVLSTIKITEKAVAKLSGKIKPKLAVLSLNPHCGEGGMFGSEESHSIIPAIEAAKAEGINAEGPLSADTLFYFASKGNYDGVVAMYHDQGLIPLKMFHFEDGVNCTLGLPIVRTSVDHGTAYDIAGSGKASEQSLLAAINMALKLAS